MSYLCKRCGVAEVEREGELCELCKIEDSSYMEHQENQFQTTPPRGIINNFNGNKTSSVIGKPARNILVNGNINTKEDVTVISSNSGDNMQQLAGQNVKVYKPDSALADMHQDSIQNSVNTHQKINTQQKDNSACKGNISNLNTDVEQMPSVYRWFRAMFKCIPYNIHGDMTSFQVFEDYTGNATNQLGYAATQVIVYGKVNNGIISNNNDVKVYGKRDGNNHILADQIQNCATGGVIKPTDVIPAGMVYGVSILVFAFIIGLGVAFGLLGFVWAAVALLCFTKLPSPVKTIGIIVGIAFTVFKFLGGL